MSELSKLQKRAKKLYRQAELEGELDCGRHMQEILRPSMGVARQEFNKIWERIVELDPKAPASPFT